MESEAASPAPAWWTAPGDTDVFAFAALAFVFLIIFLVIYFYAAFDRYAEHKATGTPLKTTVPTLLAIALAYEVFPPLGHFSLLLPLALIVGAVARDMMLWWKPGHEGEHHD